MKKQIISFVCGFACAAVLLAVPVFGDEMWKNINVLVDSIGIRINGTDVNVPNLVYEGRTYIQLRDLSSTLGLFVDYDEENNIAIVNSTDISSQSAPVLSVDGTVIAKKEFMDSYDRIISYYQANHIPYSVNEVKENVKNELVYNVMITNKAKEYGIELTADEIYEVDNEINTYIMMYGGEENLNQMLAEQGMTITSYKEAVTTHQLISKFWYFAKDNFPEFQAIEEQAKLEYEQKKDELYNPMVKAKHILIMGEDNTAINEIYSQIQAGADFDTLMKAKSEDTGLVNYPDGYTFGKGEMVAEFETTAFSLEKGSFSAPVKTAYGWHIIKLIEKYDYVPFEMFLMDYENELLAEIAEKMENEWRASMNIETYKLYEEIK